MEGTLIFNHPNLKLTHFPEESAIYEQWNGFTNDELFEELLVNVMELKIANKAKNLILDTREHKGLSPKAQKHATETCDSHARKHGQMKHAIIVSSDIFSKFSLSNFTKTFDKSTLVINEYFETLDSARKWLKNN